MRKLFYLSLILTALSLSAFSKGFKASDNPDNATVYIVRVSGYGGAAKFKLFDKQQLFGISKGKTYQRYECPAGERLIWASSENK